MCANRDKARYLKQLMAEIRALMARQKAKKAPHSLPVKPAWAVVAGFRK